METAVQGSTKDGANRVDLEWHRNQCENVARRKEGWIPANLLNLPMRDRTGHDDHGQVIAKALEFAGELVANIGDA